MINKKTQTAKFIKPMLESYNKRHSKVEDQSINGIKEYQSNLLITYAIFEK